jgi:hypothetical protein
MSIQHCLLASAVGVLLIPVVVLGGLLLTPVGLLLLAVLPIAAVTALLVLVRIAPATAPTDAHPHAWVPHTGIYST